MGHHFNDKGQFQSDRHPTLAPDKIVVSFHHVEAWPALAALAEGYQKVDPELAADIRWRLRTLQAEAEGFSIFRMDGEELDQPIPEDGQVVEARLLTGETVRARFYSNGMAAPEFGLCRIDESGLGRGEILHLAVGWTPEGKGHGGRGHGR